MKQNLFTSVLTFFACSLLWGQELKTVSYTTSEINENQVNLSENWRTIIEDNNVVIYNGNIKNQSSKNAKNLEIELYLVPQNKDAKAGLIEGYLATVVPVRNVSKNSSLVGVNISSKLETLPPAGLYNPVLVLKDKKEEVISIHHVQNTIESKDNVLALYTPKAEEKATKKDYSQVVKMEIAEDNSVVLEKEWKVEVDFKNFRVKVDGGDISNRTNKELSNLILDVYLTKDLQNLITSDFEAVHIASAQVTDKIDSYQKFVDTKVTTNLTTIPQNGTYYILLTLSTRDENGKSVVKTKRAFSNTVSF